MPIFNWSAIDLNGRLYKGIDFANTESELQAVLLRRSLGLMQSNKLRQKVFDYQIKTSIQLVFFSDLLALLEAGILLPQALQILVDQNPQRQLRCVIGYILYQVREQGVALGSVLQGLQSTFGSLVVVALHAGFAVNNLSQALQDVCGYLKNRQQMQQELRRAMMMPLLTLILFGLISAFVFGVVVPQFVTIFETVNAPVENSTRLVINLSNFFRSRSALIATLSVWLFCLFAYLGTRKGFGRQCWQSFLLHIPVFGRLVRYQNLFSFLQSAALLTKGGVQAVEAFEQATLSVENVILKKQCRAMTQLITQGTPISVAMQQAAPGLFFTDVITLAAIGEESGCLGAVLGRAAILYQKRFTSLLQIVLTLVQPALIILLGILVALLIFAIYIPIFNLPAIIT